MDRVIMDASVFMKWALDEQYADEAYALRDAHIMKRLTIVVPSIFYYEVLNATRYSKGCTQERLGAVAEALDNYAFESFDLRERLATLASEVSVKHDISMYDAAYVALAILTRSCLYTADEKLIKDVKSPYVRHIKDFNSRGK